MDIQKLAEFRRGIRPPTPASLPQYFDTELARNGAALNQIIQALKDLDARLTAAGL